MGLQQQGEQRSLPLPGTHPGQPVQGVQWGGSPEEDTHGQVQAAMRTIWNLLWDWNMPGMTHLAHIPWPVPGIVLVATDGQMLPSCVNIAAACRSGGARSKNRSHAVLNQVSKQQNILICVAGRETFGAVRSVAAEEEMGPGPVLDKTELD